MFCIFLFLFSGLLHQINSSTVANFININKLKKDTFSLRFTTSFAVTLPIVTIIFNGVKTTSQEEVWKLYANQHKTRYHHTGSLQPWLATNTTNFLFPCACCVGKEGVDTTKMLTIQLKNVTRSKIEDLVHILTLLSTLYKTTMHADVEYKE